MSLPNESTLKLCIALVGSVLVASAAWAGDGAATDSVGQDTVGHWYIAPQAGVTIADGNRDVNNNGFYGLAIGKHINEDWSAELNALSGRHGGRNGAPGTRITALSFDALRVFDRDATFSPFVTAGAGMIMDVPNGGDTENHLLAQAGVGALVHLWEDSSGATNFSLRPEVKVRWDDNGNYQHPVDMLLGIGFEFAFGAPRPEAAPPPPPPPPPPAPAATAPAAPPPAASPAPPPRLVGEITLRGVHFATNKAQLTPESSAILDPIAASLKAYPDLRVEVQGHTDGRGTAAYNLKLSQARANAVRDYLIAQGVPPDELTAKGYGKTRPIADNRTAQGRARNRRVVLEVLDNPRGVTVKHHVSGQ